MRTESNIALDNFEERTEMGNNKYHANTSTTRAKLHVLLFRNKNYFSKFRKKKKKLFILKHTFPVLKHLSALCLFFVFCVQKMCIR